MFVQAQALFPDKAGVTLLALYVVRKVVYGIVTNVQKRNSALACLQVFVFFFVPLRKQMHWLELYCVFDETTHSKDSG